MNIIFGDAVKEIPNSYTVLELDTIRFMPANQCVSAWCVVESIPLEELHLAEANKKMHEDLIAQYRHRNWDFCSQAVTALLGCWNKELDTFYYHMLNRISQYQQTPPPDDWDATLIKEAILDSSLEVSGTED